MLPLELYKYAMPPRPGTMLCERLAMPMRRGILFLPFATREYSRCHEAVVVHSAAAEFMDGQKLFIAASAQQAVTFGLGAEERTLWVVTPHQVLFTLTDFPDKMIEKGTQHHLANYDSKDFEEFDRAGDKFDEGSPEGLQ